MLQEMRVRNYSPNTITTYISLLAALARHFNKSPDLISSDELKDYLFKKISQDQLSPSAINQIISAFRILQVDVLGKDWDPIKVKRPKMPKTLPLVFSKEEISAILASLKNRKHYCLVALTYAAGLRLNEVVNLKPADLDSSRMQIRISSGKGNKAPGSLSVLHTWGQALTYHPHIHMLVPAGGLDPDHNQWIHAHRKFFVPVKALASIYRGIFISGLTKLLGKNSLRIPDDQTDIYTHPDQLKKTLYAKNWHVYIKKTFRGAAQVISYLGRYTHRVAISNNRIISCQDDKVSFRWKDYRDNKQKTMTLPAREFATRFLRHILPDNFYKIRYYGILASCGGTSKIDSCLELLGKPLIRSPLEGLTTYQILEKILGSEAFT
jgi:integrase